MLPKQHELKPSALSRYISWPIFGSIFWFVRQHFNTFPDSFQGTIESENKHQNASARTKCETR